MAITLIKANNAKSTLNGAITSGTSLVVVSATKFPITVPFLCTIWDKSAYPDPSDDPNMEIVKVTTVAGTTFTITRAQESTSNVSHANGSAVEMLLTKGHFDEIETEIATKTTVTITNGLYIRLDGSSTTSAAIPFAVGASIATNQGITFNGVSTDILNGDGTNVYLKAANAVVIGNAGDIVLGDNNLRTMYPQTDLMMDLGTNTFRFNDIYCSRLCGSASAADRISFATANSVIANATTSFLVAIGGTTKYTFASGTLTFADAQNMAFNTTTGTKIGTATTQKIGFYNATPVVRPTDGATLTNNVTSGGTTDTIANYTDLVTYANDAAAIRNNIYQLSRKLKIVVDNLRTLGLAS